MAEDKKKEIEEIEEIEEIDENDPLKAGTIEGLTEMFKESQKMIAEQNKMIEELAKEKAKLILQVDTKPHEENADLFKGLGRYGKDIK